MHQSAFVELSLVIITTLLVCGLLKILKQPVLIGYVLAGLLLSPNFLNVLQSQEGLSTFSQIGISFLLFMVGLGLNPKSIKEIGKTALFTTTIQILLCTAIYYAISRAFGFSDIGALYIGLGLSFSSTIIIMKILTDKMTLNTLPGKLSVGMLIIQDLIAMIILMVISATSKGGDLTTTIILTVSKGLILFGLLYIISVEIIPFLIKKIAHTQELLMLFSIGWCMALASLFYLMDFSIEIGALLAGVSLALSPYRHEISAKIKPLRDFFIMLFFVFLGAQISFKEISNLIIPLVIFSILVLTINPLIVSLLIGRQGYTKKTSFLTGTNFSQISEFSLILAALGLKVGHLNSSTLSLLTLLGLVSITGSTYLISFSEKIYNKMPHALNFLEKKGQKKDQHKNYDQDSHEIILIGYAKMDSAFLETFKKMGKNFLVIDYDPHIINELNKENIDCLYADASNSETYEEINLHQTKMVISTIKDLDTNLLIISKTRQVNPKAIIITLSHHPEEALKLYEYGADYVTMPFYIGSHHTSSLISEFGYDLEKFIIEKNKHISKLLVKNSTAH